MPSIVAYRKHSDKYTTYFLQTPEPAMDEEPATELCTIGGVTYVSLPDGMRLPEDQFPEIVDSIAPVVLTEKLAVEIAVASPHVWLANERAAARQTREGAAKAGAFLNGEMAKLGLTVSKLEA